MILIKKINEIAVALLLILKIINAYIATKVNYCMVCLWIASNIKYL